MGEESAAESIELLILHDQEYESSACGTIKRTYQAYIKVQDGCNQFCSYCIIPYARGRVKPQDGRSVRRDHESDKTWMSGICDHRNSCYIVWKDLGDVTPIDLLEEIAKIPKLRESV